MGSLWRSCVKVLEPIQLPFEVMIRAVQAGLLGGGSTSFKVKRMFFSGRIPIDLCGVLNVFLKHKCTRLVSAKLTVILHRQFTVGIVINAVLKSILCCEIEVGIYDRFARM